MESANNEDQLFNRASLTYGHHPTPGEELKEKQLTRWDEAAAGNLIRKGDKHSQISSLSFSRSLSLPPTFDRHICNLLTVAGLDDSSFQVCFCSLKVNFYF